MAWRATDFNLRGKQIFLADFYATMVSYCKDEANLDHEDRKKDPYIENPDNLSHSKWVVWDEMVYTSFTSMENPRITPRICHTQYPRSIRHFHGWVTGDYTKCSPTGQHVFQ